MWPEPIELKGQHVVLAPLSLTHADDLARASAEGQMHRLWYTSVPAAQDVPAEIERRLALLDQGKMVPFAALTPAGRAVGMTTFMNIDAGNRRVEIGSTWYGPAVQRTPINTECKLMLLSPFTSRKRKRPGAAPA